MAASNRNQSVSPPFFFLGSEENPHYSTISFDIDRYLSNCDPVSAFSDSVSPSNKKGPGFLLALSLSGFVPHSEVVFFLTRGKDALVLPSWVQSRPDHKYLLSFPSSHSGRAYLDSFGQGRLEVGTRRVVARFYPIIQPKRPSPSLDPPLAKSRRPNTIPAHPPTLSCDPPVRDILMAQDSPILPGDPVSPASGPLPSSGNSFHFVPSTGQRSSPAPGPSGASLVMQQVDRGPSDHLSHFSFSPRPSGDGLRVEVLGSRLPAKATLAYDDGVGGHFEISFTGDRALELLARSELFEEFSASPPCRPTPEVERNLACAFAQWFGHCAKTPTR